MGEKEEKSAPLATVFPSPPPTAEERTVLKEGEADIVKKIIVNLEQTYRDEKAKEIQNLYNDFVDVITKRKPHISNILTALELVKQEILTQKLDQIRRETTT